MDLRAKRVLITAGPTWVAIDDVRVISNTASGQTGIILARSLQQAGARVTLLLGPASADTVFDRKKKLSGNRGIRIRRFRFFGELQKLLRAELDKPCDVVVHAAAVADYRPAKKEPGKLPSGNTRRCIQLIPTPKLIDHLRTICPQAFLVGFKFEYRSNRTRLIHESRRLLKRARLDLVVGNTSGPAGYQAYLVGKTRHSPVLVNRKHMVKALLKELKRV